MPWRVEFDQRLGAIRCTYAGHLNLEDIKQATLRAIALSKEYRSQRALIDTVELTSAISTIDIYRLPEFYATTQAERKSRWALLLPPSGQIRDDAQFYVTVCQNRGWFIQAFDDRNEAIAWLKEQPGADNDV